MYLLKVANMCYLVYLVLLVVLIGQIVADSEWSLNIPYITLSELEERGKYDFIVIGAGASGSVLATRLALHPSYPSVLLIEAGNKANLSSQSPEMIPPVSFDLQLTEIDWSYKTVPQKTCCKGSINRQSIWPRGKVMGGSTVLNGMFWVYGHPEDWDKINKINGWSSKDILPFFHKIEDYHSYPYTKNIDNVITKRGKNGPIEINEVRNLLNSNTSILVTKFVESCIQSGYEFIDDINDWESNGNKIGCHYAQNNIEYESGLRSNAFVGYMRYLMNSKAFKEGKINLDILSNAHVTKIRFNDEIDDQTDNMKHIANGIEFMYQDEPHMHFVGLKSSKRGEIIVSGGAIGSPQLLLLSGIGPSQQLEKYNIDIIEDIKGVGQNLQDHVFVATIFHLKEEYFDKTVTANSFHLNLKTSTLEANAFTSTTNSAGFPDIKYHFIRGGMLNPKYFNFIENGQTNLLQCGDEKYYEDLDNVQGIWITTILEHPESRGEITLSSSDPLIYPNIDPKYLSKESDVEILKNGYKFLLKLMDGIKDDVWDKRLKCTRFGDIDNDDNALEEFVKAAALHQYHPCCTNKMGNNINDPMVVVDTELRLKNMENVRVADASILPNVVSGNTQAACFMIGERAAEFILKDWEDSKTNKKVEL